MTSCWRARSSTSVPLALSIVALLALCVSSGAVPAVVLICLIVVCMTAAAQACWATVTELVPPERVGGVSGFVHLLSNISGIIGPAATGFAVQYFGGFDTAFLLAAVIAFLGTVAMVLFVKSQPQSVRAPWRSPNKVRRTDPLYRSGMVLAF